MRSSGDTALFGRDRECQEIDRVVAALKSNAGAGLVLAGEAGSGKTELLRYAAVRADGVRVLAARGVPAERVLPFSGLHGLLGPVVDLLDHIPPRQAAALSSAFTLSPATAVDLFAVAAGTLSVLAVAGDRSPLLVLVDDLHLLDPESREALLFVARRAMPGGVGLLFTTAADGAETDLPCHRLPPLDEPAGRALLARASGRPVAPAVVDRVVRAVAGNALALVEAPEMLTGAELSGAEPLPEPLPVGPRVRRAFAPRLAALRPPERTVLLAAAAAGAAGVAELLLALDALGLPPEALEAVEAAGLIHLGDDAVAFDHPLLRAVAYHAASPAQRRAVHRELAEVVPRAQRAWHLGVAALGPDEQAAGELETTAAGGMTELSAGGAARLMERAAQLSRVPDARARRYVAAAELWQLAGAGGRVRELLDQARLADDLRVRARGQAVLARTECRCGRPAPAQRTLVREAAKVRGTDPEAGVAMLLDAADACCLTGDPQAALVAVRRARQFAGTAPAPLGAALTAQHAAVLAACGRLTEARDVLDGCRTEIESVVRGAELPADWRQSLVAGLPAVLIRLGELDAARRLLDETIGRARALELLGLLPGLLALRAELSRRTGDWDDAQAGGAEAARLAERLGQTTELAGALVGLAGLAALRGQRTDSLAHLDRARELVQRGRLHGLSVPIGAVEGLLELGDGNDAAAFVRLERVAQQVAAGRPADHGWVYWLPDLVEAATRAGHREEARRVFTPALRHLSGSLSLRPVAARCAALLADSAEQAEQHFIAALRPGPEPEPFERARSELCFGEWLNGRGRPAAAAMRIRGALATFDALGAEPWARRARNATAALTAAHRPPPGGPGPAPDTEAAPVADPAGSRHPSLRCLTAQERRVAVLVGQGATNREAAGALFLSTKTIEFHLRSVYRKLGVRSRAELAHLMGRGERDPVSA